MTSALFVFRKKVTSVDNPNEVEYNDNFINLQNVISAYWSRNASGQRVLSVFTLTYTFTFPEQTGERFINHLEEYQCCLIAAPSAPALVNSSLVTQRQHSEGPRRTRNAMSTEEIIEEQNQPETTWGPA